eukprot:scaffold43838_cov68-Attheya_sp.AAC.2
MALILLCEERAHSLEERSSCPVAGAPTSMVPLWYQQFGLDYFWKTGGEPPSKHRKPGHGACIADDCTRSAECNTKTTHPDIGPKTPHAPYPLLPNRPPSADWMPKLKHICKPSSVPITHPPSMIQMC